MRVCARARRPKARAHHLAAGARSTRGAVSVRRHVGTVQHVLGGREPQVSGNTRVYLGFWAKVDVCVRLPVCPAAVPSRRVCRWSMPACLWSLSCTLRSRLAQWLWTPTPHQEGLEQIPMCSILPQLQQIGAEVASPDGARGGRTGPTLIQGALALRIQAAEESGPQCSSPAHLDP